jgi:hypothetical protein
MPTLKAYANSSLAGACYEIKPNVGAIFYSVWHDRTAHRPKDIPVGPGVTSIKFYLDSTQAGEIWSDNDALAGDVYRYWRNDIEPETGHFSVVPMPIQPPDPTPIPPTTGSSMDWPQTEADLRRMLQGYADAGIVGMFDPRTQVTTTGPIIIVQTNNGGSPWGVNGNYAKITYKGPAGQPVLRYQGYQGVNNRGLTIKNLTLDGGDVGNMSGAGASVCLHLYAPLGDNGPLYKFHLENIFTMGAVNGVFIQGGVYEGMMQNVHAENCTGDGIRMEHMLNPVPAGAKDPIVSNVLLLHPNSSRNYGAGIHSVFSVGIIGGSYILNGAGGIVAPDGLRWAMMNNGENTGGKDQAVIVVPSNGYGSFISMLEASGDGVTCCRRWDGTKWIDVGKPLLYGAAIAGGVSVDKVGIGYYGPAPNPMKFTKPL